MHVRCLGYICDLRFVAASAPADVTTVKVAVTIVSWKMHKLQCLLKAASRIVQISIEICEAYSTEICEAYKVPAQTAC